MDVVRTVLRRVRQFAGRPGAELGLLLVAVLAYCSAFLKFGPQWRLPGNEAELFQSFGLVLYKSLFESGQFPLWNPYIRTGLPFVADPMLYIYNPLVSLPVLLIGPWDGFKVALLLSFGLAGWGMWQLCRTLGIGAPVRLWVALLYIFAGQPAARFFQGEYLFVFGFAWIPWIVHHLFQVAKTPRRGNVAWAVLSLAMLYLCGNAYYPFLMLFVVALFLLVMVPQERALQERLARRWYRLRVDWEQSGQRLLPFLLVGALALGLIAIHFLPLAEFWPRLNKGLGAYGSHNLGQIYLDYTSKDSFRPDAYQELPAREEFYAYIGLAPFLALACLPLAFRSRPRRPLVFLLLVLVFTLVYIDLKDMPWRDWYEKIKIFSQFRHLLRPLILGSFALLLLGGLGLDEAWQRLAARVDQQGWKRWAAVVGLVALAGLMLWSTGDVYRANRPHLAARTANQAIDRLAKWLRAYDTSEYGVRFNPNNTALYALLDAGLRFRDAWYPLDDFSMVDLAVTSRPVRPAPQYILQAANEVEPASPFAQLVQEQEGYQVYWLPDSLPLAFTVEQTELEGGAAAGPLRRAQVFPLQPLIHGPNEVEIVADRPAGNVLVLLMTYYPGWQVRVDGRAAALKNVGGYLGVEVQPGGHQYRFVFRPLSFALGLGISLLSLGVVCFLLFSQARQEIPDVTRNIWERVRDWRSAVAIGQHQEAAPAPPARALSLRQALKQWVKATFDVFDALAYTVKVPGLLFLLSLGVYLVTRLIRLEDFPIYFFADEAVQTLFAEQLIKSGFRDAQGVWLPVYVEAAASRWTPLLPMYFHALTLTLFGKSIFVTRATSAVISVLAPLAAGLMLKTVFKARYWWVGALLLGITPAWLLHSRTAFETVMTTTFYACFLLGYLLYRTRAPRFLYLALVCAAAAFYTYSNGQVVIAGAGLLLFLSDLPYHWRQRRTLLGGALLGVILALPLLFFRWNHPAALGEHLRAVNSYWFQPISLAEKATLFAQKLAYGLSPQYWFLSNGQDLVRHRWDSQGHILWGMLPFVLAGVLICLWKVRSAPHRALLLAAVATPLGAALVEIGITRVLAFVVPASIFAGLGLDWTLNQLERLPRLGRGEAQAAPRPASGGGLLAWGAFLILTWASFSLLNQGLNQGPRWFSDYGLYGMQYGARQLFEQAIPELLAKDAQAQVLVTSTWANGADRFLNFFFSQEELRRVRVDGVQTYLFKKMPLSGNEVFVMTPAEYDQAAASPKFINVHSEQILRYPDGSPGFLFVRLAYAPNVDEIFAAEKAARSQLVDAQVTLDGQIVAVRHSVIDMGAPELMFDGDHFTLMRGLEANPFVLELTFPEPRTLSRVEADFGLAEITLTVLLYVDGSGEPLRYVTERSNASSQDPQMVLNLPEAPPVTHVRFEVFNRAAGEVANIHIRELILLP